MSLTVSTLESHNRKRRGSTYQGHDGSGSNFQRQASVDDRSEGRSESNYDQGISPRGGPRTKSITSNESGSNTESVKVVCRVRPFNRREQEIQDEMNNKYANDWEKVPLRSIIDMVGQKTTNFLDHEKDYIVRQSFAFDHSLWSVAGDQQQSDQPMATQETVYDIVGAPAVANVWSGYNVCVFAYGQTGSGKTHSMMGATSDPGLIPRICRALFEELQVMRSGPPPDDHTVMEYKLEARFLEIYNEKVKDLLWALREPGEATEGIDRENMKIRLVPGSGPQVSGLTTVQVNSTDDCIMLIEEGTRNRSVAATKMNEQSSRSHSIFRLTLTQTTTSLPKDKFDKPKHYHRTSTVSLVDLAGSERNKKTGAEGDRLKEAVAINKSLTTLKNVIDALVDGRNVVPYRDSTLTWLLSDNLGGNSKTFMIACVSPHLDNADETLNTLRYAMRAQQVVTHASVNEDDELRKMAKMKEEVQKMKSQLLDTGEETLRQRREELNANVEQKKQEAQSQLQLVDVLNQALDRSKELQLSAAYANRFQNTMNERAERELLSQTTKLQHEIDMLEVDLRSLRSDVTQDAQARREASRDASESTNKRQKLQQELSERSSRGTILEEKQGELLEEDQRCTEAIERMGPLIDEARRIACVIVAHEMHMADHRVNRVGVQLLEEVEERQAEESRTTEAVKEAAQLRIEDAKQRKAELIELIKEAQEEQAEVQSQLEDRAKRLHSRCIFFENENKRCVKRADEELIQAAQREFTDLQADEEAWKAKVAALHSKHRAVYDRDRDEFKERENVRQTEVVTDTMQIEDAAAKVIQRIKAATNEELNDAVEGYRYRLRLLTDLNVDSTTFIKEAKTAEPRYDHLYDSLSSYQASSSRRTRAQASDVSAAIESMKAVVVEQRRTTTPLSFRPDLDEAANSMGSRTPKRSRSVNSESRRSSSAVRDGNMSTNGHYRSSSRSPSMANGGGAYHHEDPQGSPTSNGEPRAPPPYSVANHADIGEIKSLRPARVTPAPTRASLMRMNLVGSPTFGSPKSAGSVRTPSESRGRSKAPATNGASSPRGSHPPTTAANSEYGGVASADARSGIATTRVRRSSERATRNGGTNATPPPALAMAAARKERQAERLGYDLTDLPHHEPPALYRTDPRTHAYVAPEADGTKRRAFHCADGLVLLTRSRSPAAPFSSNAGGGRQTSTSPQPGTTTMSERSPSVGASSSTPRRTGGWR